MGQGRTWTTQEIQYLKENWEIYSDKEIAEYLKRPVDGVSSKRKKLKLIRDKHKYTFKDVKDEFDKTDYILLSTSDEYIDSAKNTLRYICPKHKQYGEQKISLGHLMSGRGCFYCGRERTIDSKTINLNNIKPYQDLCMSKNFTFDSVYRKNGKIYINYVCNRHKNIGIQTMQHQNMKRDFVNGCPYCGESNGEFQVRKILEDLQISYKPQYKFNDLKDNGFLRFDFYIGDMRKAIEFDGIQHYVPTRFNGITEERANELFKETKKHDEMKNQYCANNNIELLRIPYYDIDNVRNIVYDFILR